MRLRSFTIAQRATAGITCTPMRTTQTKICGLSFSQLWEFDLHTLTPAQLAEVSRIVHAMD